MPNPAFAQPNYDWRCKVCDRVNPKLTGFCGGCQSPAVATSLQVDARKGATLTDAECRELERYERMQRLPPVRKFITLLAQMCAAGIVLLLKFGIAMVSLTATAVVFGLLVAAALAIALLEFNTNDRSEK